MYVPIDKGKFCNYAVRAWTCRSIIQRSPIIVVRCLLFKENFSTDYCNRCKFNSLNCNYNAQLKIFNYD